MKRRRNELLSSLPLFLLLAVAGVAGAQSTGTISGTVTDPSGAVVPQVQITIHGNATGVDRSVVSDGSGNYTVPSLQPGDYQVSARAAGFSLYTLKSLILQVDQKATVNIALGLASAGDVVQVDSTALLIDAQTSTVGQVIDQKTVVTGSFNFSTNAGCCNAGNLLIIDRPELAVAYAENFARRRQVSVEYVRKP